jgi:glycosyltransferase involved in cell wall biosynthesis
MKISVLVSDASKNCMGRAYILSKVLNGRFNVELVGPMFGSDIWPAFDRAGMEGIDCKFVSSKGYPLFLKSLFQVIGHITGDVIYALKPLATSYGVALLLKLVKRPPIILDIDDWELGLAKWRLARSRLGLIKVRDPNWLGWTYLLDKLTSKADQITVSSKFLAQKYGGTILPHGRDVQLLDPAQYDAEELRSALGLSDKTILLFLGTPKPYKGIEDLITAVRLIDEKHIKILLVGADRSDPFVCELLKQAEDILQITGMQPMSERPRWLAIADAVVLPQRLSPATVGQIPAKIFDAMAMAKPIVATAVSDIPSILDGCGLVVPPGDLDALANGIAYILEHPVEATEMGTRARQRCVERYSWDAMDRVLKKVVSCATDMKRNQGWSRGEQSGN